MKTSIRGAAALALIACLGAQAATPGHPALSHLPLCRDVSVVDACRIDVPNGNFAGFEGDDFAHAYEFPSWRPTHTVAEHIVPWRYLDPGNRGGGQVEAGSTLTLLQRGDSVEQRLPLPALPTGAHVTYAVHAHTATWTGDSRVRMDISLRDGSGVITRANAAVVMNKVSDEPRSELLAWINVPDGTNPTDLDIAIGMEDGLGRVPVSDVVVVRAQQDDPVPELAVRW
ncbi:hypothetical protein ABIE56_003109 [Luteibacter sp. 621]|jgi:hypothetical protein|uniref:hypothetical protein n=1 Tax=Luteibacter sp. 621 TaxID=3373916 RepID=UPI003D1C055E